MWSSECGVRSAEFGVRRLGVRGSECGGSGCGVRSAELGVRSWECGVGNAELGMRSRECGVGNAEFGVRTFIGSLVHRFTEVRPNDCGTIFPL